MKRYLSTGGLTPDDTRLLGAAVGDTVQHGGTQFRFGGAVRDGLECVVFPFVLSGDICDGLYAEYWTFPEWDYDGVSVSVLDGVVRTFIGPVPAPMHAVATSFALVRVAALVKAAHEAAQLKTALREALRRSRS